jgi:hypothetical protein
MSYGHATALATSIPPSQQLAFLVRELGKWAELNPKLRPLHEQFARVSGEISAATAARTVPAPRGDVRPARQLDEDRRRRCPVCRAMPGHPCVSKSGMNLWSYVHARRRKP